MRPPMSVWWRTRPRMATRSPCCEYGQEHEHVGEVAAAGVGIVVDDHVPGLEIVAEIVETASQCRHRGAELGRQRQPLGHHLAVRVADGAREIHSILDQGRARGADHAHHDVVGDRRQPVLDELAAEGIYLHALSPAPIRAIRPTVADPGPARMLRNLYKPRRSEAKPR